VAEELLDGSDVAVVFEEVGPERVAQRVAGGRLRDAGEAYGLLHGALQDGLVQVVATPLARHSVDVEAGGRKHPLPYPLAPGVRVLPGERPGQLHPAGSASQISIVLTLDQFEMPDEVGLHGGGQHRHAVTVALAGPHDDLVGGEVHVLDPEVGAFEQAQTRAV